MLKLIFSRPQPSLPPAGWMVEVTVPFVGAKERMQRLFAVGTADKDAAETLTRQTVGNLHCSITARVKLASRALANLQVAEGGVQEIDAG